MPGTHPPAESIKAPIFLSNSGTYSSITEFGHIFDPIQWRPVAFWPSGSKPASSAATATIWKDAWKSIMQADSNYGDASTLRIGSAEFKQFDKDDSRASQLMDLFAVSDRIDTRGLINLNTASREALRALAAGIQISSDPAITPTTVFGPVSNSPTAAQADVFANAVLASRPLLTRSQLSGILTNPADTTSKLFGNATQWSAGGPTEWTDTAREEYFARMFNLATVRSRNFRVFVTGQSLDKNGRVLSTVSRVFQVHLNPTRDSTGKITSQRVQTTYEKDI
jgi:hypothetical protein